MRNNNISVGAGTFAFSILFTLAIFVGFIMNIYKLTQANFIAPYKNEVTRIIGIAIPFVGGVTGYININD